MRNTLAQILYELARHDDRIVVLVADISPAGAMEQFRAEFPRRFINVGVAEQSMIGLAAGLAQRGFRPFCYTIATFALFRAYEFIRCDLAYQNLPVTVVGMGAGLSYSTLGGTHQAVEDVAVAMACPNLTVLAPCDPAEVAECVRWCAAPRADGPVYLRIGKAGERAVTGSDPRRALDGIRLLRSSVPRRDTLVLSYGPLATVALDVSRRIAADMGVVVVLAPLHSKVVQRVAGYQRVVVVEEASGAPLANALCSQIRNGPDILSFALPRTLHLGQGTRDELLAECGLTVEKIVTTMLDT